MKNRDLTLADILPYDPTNLPLPHSMEYASKNRSQSTFPPIYSIANIYHHAITNAKAYGYGVTKKTYVAYLYELLQTQFGDASTDPFLVFFNDVAKGGCVDTLIGQYILPKMRNTIVCSVDDIDDNASDDTSALFTSVKAVERVDQMLAWFHEDGIERIKLISLMESNLADLLNKVETINWRRDNNTPQDADDPDDDTHLSYYSKNINSTDLTTLMARIKEIKDNIFDEYQEWATDFERKFAIMCL